jgi:hypothetical protein
VWLPGVGLPATTLSGALAHFIAALVMLSELGGGMNHGRAHRQQQQEC